MEQRLNNIIDCKDQSVSLLLKEIIGRMIRYDSLIPVLIPVESFYNIISLVIYVINEPKTLIIIPDVDYGELIGEVDAELIHRLLYLNLTGAEGHSSSVVRRGIVKKEDWIRPSFSRIKSIEHTMKNCADMSIRRADIHLAYMKDFMESFNSFKRNTRDEYNTYSSIFVVKPDDFSIGKINSLYECKKFFFIKEQYYTTL